MHGGNSPPVRVHEKDGHAVGRADTYQNARTVSDRGIRLGPGVSPCMVRAHD